MGYHPPMADDEHWYAHWEQGAFWGYGEGYGLRLRREVTDVVAWRMVGISYCDIWRVNYNSKKFS